MSYLVRKIIKRENIDEIGETANINEMYADAATYEFRSKNGMLSTWMIDSIEKINDAILAILVTSNKIDTMDFILLNTEVLKKYQLEYKRTYAGLDIAVPDLQDTHYDIYNITIPKLINCVSVYKDTFLSDNKQEIFIIRKIEQELINILKEAHENNRIVFEKLNKGVKKYIRE